MCVAKKLKLHRARTISIRKVKKHHCNLAWNDFLTEYSTRYLVKDTLTLLSTALIPKINGRRGHYKVTTKAREIHSPQDCSKFGLTHEFTHLRTRISIHNRSFLCR